MFCRNCGKEMNENEEQCLSCGWKKGTSIKNIPDKKPSKVLFVLIAILIIIVIFYFIYMLIPPHFKNDGIGDYYKKSNGAYAANEWVKIKNNWYYFNPAGYLAKGGVTADGYYVDENGKMAKKEWKKINGIYFYFDTDGKIAKNKWIEDNKKWYYVDANGAMLKNTWVDGHFINEQGERTNNCDLTMVNCINEDKKIINKNYVENITLNRKLVIDYISINMSCYLTQTYMKFYSLSDYFCGAKFDKYGNLWEYRGSKSKIRELRIHNFDNKSKTIYVFSYIDIGKYADTYMESYSADAGQIIDRTDITFDEVIKKINEFYNMVDCYEICNKPNLEDVELYKSEISYCENNNVKIPNKNYETEPFLCLINDYCENKISKSKLIYYNDIYYYDYPTCRTIFNDYAFGNISFIEFNNRLNNYLKEINFPIYVAE